MRGRGGAAAPSPGNPPEGPPLGPPPAAGRGAAPRVRRRAARAEPQGESVPLGSTCRAAAGLTVNGAALLRIWAPPAYPPDAVKERMGGEASIRMVVDEKGIVTLARVLDATDPRLGEAALAAARKWVFSPALDSGKPVAI